MMEDESTDDELGVNLQLGERLQIRQPHSSYHNTRARTRNSKEHKEYWNGRKKDLCSSSCSTALNPHCPESAPVNGWFVPDTPSPYQLGNKKRQNKDRNGEQIAKSKRTCFNVYPNWKEGKIRNRHCKDPQHCASISRDCSNFPEIIVKTEPSASASTSGTNDFSDMSGSALDSALDILQKNISPDEKYRDFMENTPSFSEIDGTNSSSSNFSSADLLHGNGKRNGNSLKSYDASLSFPSTSSSGQSYADTIQSGGPRPTRSIPLGVQYIDSESDESNILHTKRGALKGGKQIETTHFQSKVTNKSSAQVLESDNSDDTENIHYHNKVIGKCNRRVVESDDSDDSSWQPAFHKHRSKLLLSESEESVEEQSQSLLSRTRGFTNLKKNTAASFDSRCSSYSKKAPYVPLPCDDKSNDESDHFTSGCYRRHQGSVTHKSPKKSSRPRRGTNSKTINKRFPSCDCSSPGPASQSKLRSCLRHHRSGSPHPRSLRQRRHSRGLSRTSSGQMNNLSNQSCVKTGFCKEFDAEDSSDVEFFSANSYSDGETSESFGGIDINSTLTACPGLRSEGSHSCERTASAPESSEDEVSVVFTANPPFRDGNNSRHRRHRGTARRRHSRVSSRVGRSQDQVSVSPDPVEQVRQMEEDERLARFLQAQFDAEVVTEECRPEAHHHHHHHNIVDSDDEEDIDPVGDINDDMGWIYDETLQMENSAADHHHHHSFSHSPNFLSPALHRGRARGRPRMAVLSFSGINNLSGRGRHVRRRYLHGGISGDAWMWQFARMMGQTLAGRSFDSEGADYEALWELAEDVGEAVPRGLNKSEINRLPTRKYVNNSSGNDATSSKDFDETAHKRTELNKECQVCLCDYENGDVLRILPCFHEFHTACIDPWLKINHTCPVCRVEVDLEEN